MFCSEQWNLLTLYLSSGRTTRGLGGFICAHDLGFRGYISALIVADRARRKGIGRQLVRRVETELIQRGCRTLVADVWRDAEYFYRSLGWSTPDVSFLRKALE